MGPRETRGRRGGAGARHAGPGIAKEEIDGIPYSVFANPTERHKFQEQFLEAQAAQKRIEEFKKYETELNERRSRKSNPSLYQSSVVA